MTELLDPAQLGQVLDAADRDVFRWETLPAYEVASDGSDYRRYLDGEKEPTWERKQRWLDTLRSWAEQGKTRRRVRVIHDPITDYERYECEWGYALNAGAGELIRVIDLAETQLPRELEDDFWLVDGHDVVLMHYEPSGWFNGASRLSSRSPQRYLELADYAWELGKDFGEWWTAHPEHHRAARSAA